MSVCYLTKIEINLPIKDRTLTHVLPQIMTLFEKLADGLTYTVPTVPAPIRGRCANPEKKGKIEDEDIVWIDEDIVWIYVCYDIKNNPPIKQTIGEIEAAIIAGGNESSAWITYSTVCRLVSTPE